MNSSHAQGGRQWTLLVVDDEPGVRLSVEYCLSSTGYRTICKESGAAALAHAAQEPVDGALLDVHMPGMNGFDTCIALQTQARAMGRSLKIWFMTGAYSAAVQGRCAQLGSLGLMKKPFDFPQFIADLDREFSAKVSPALVNSITGTSTSAPM